MLLFCRTREKRTERKKSRGWKENLFLKKGLILEIGQAIFKMSLEPLIWPKIREILRTEQTITIKSTLIGVHQRDTRTN